MTGGTGREQIRPDGVSVISLTSDCSISCEVRGHFFAHAPDVAWPEGNKE